MITKQQVKRQSKQAISRITTHQPVLSNSHGGDIVSTSHVTEYEQSKLSPKNFALLQCMMGNQVAKRALQGATTSNVTVQNADRRNVSKPTFLAANKIQRQEASSPYGATRLNIPPEEVLAVTIHNLQSARPATFNTNLGAVTITPGEIIKSPLGQEYFIVSLGSTLIFAKGNTLYEINTMEFIRSLYLDAIQAGAKRAEGMARLARLEMELIMALGPAYARWGVTIVKGIVWLTSNYDTIKHLGEWSKKLLTLRKILKEKFPNTYQFIWNQIQKTAIQNISFDLEPTDYAKLIGSLLRSGGVEGLEIVARTLWQTISIVTFAITKTTAVGIGRGTVQSTKDQAHKLAETLKSMGMAISNRDVNRLLRELSKPEVIELLRSLQQAFYAISQDIKVLFSNP